MLFYSSLSCLWLSYLFSLSLLCFRFSLSVDLVVLGVDFGGWGLNRWPSFESVAKPWVSSRWFWRRWALVSGLGLESVALGFGFGSGTWISGGRCGCGGLGWNQWVEIWRRGLAAISVSLNQWLSQWLWVAAGVGVVAWVELVWRLGILAWVLMVWLGFWLVLCFSSVDWQLV